VWWFLPANTPDIQVKDRNALSTIDYINLGGVEQSVLIRSKDTHNPILLFLHGGPGMPLMYLAHDFQKPLENDFTVVQWDRRGAGKTYVRNQPTSASMNIRQLINDAYALIDTLRHRYHQKKVILVGHSFGTYLGSIMVHENPALFRAYISVGQVVDSEKARSLQEKFIRHEARLRGERDIIDKLNKTPNLSLEHWLFEFGGELKHSTSFYPLIWSGIQAPEYTLAEVLKVAQASAFSSSHMKYNVLKQSIYEEIRDYDVPIYFFVGTADYTTPHELITKYYHMINAPEKKIIYFDNSAHFPFFEEPDKFCAEIKRVLTH